jgi:hypothetical protein
MLSFLLTVNLRTLSKSFLLLVQNRTTCQLLFTIYYLFVNEQLDRIDDGDNIFYRKIEGKEFEQLI